MSLQLKGEETLNTVVSVGPRAEKFNIVSNDHGRTQNCDFSVFAWKYPFWANLVQKLKIVSLSWTLVLIRIFHGDVHFFCFWPEKYLFWANLVHKIKIVTLRWNLAPRLMRICNIQWWCPLFLFLTVNILLGQICS